MWWIQLGCEGDGPFEQYECQVIFFSRLFVFSIHFLNSNSKFKRLQWLGPRECYKDAKEGTPGGPEAKDLVGTESTSWHVSHLKKFICPENEELAKVCTTTLPFVSY